MIKHRLLPVVSAVAAIAAFAFVASASAGADMPATGRPVPPPPTSPTSADQIQNIDQVRTAIKGYYGDTLTSVPDPVNGSVLLHTFSPTGAYADEVSGVAAQGKKFLAQYAQAGRATDKPAIVFDIDDTTLNTYNYEIYSNFAYNPITNAAFVNNAAFPAVPGMVSLEKKAETLGYTVFWITGRPISQQAGTVTNLDNAGYDVVDSNLYLKDQTATWLSSCAPTCTTIQYKSLTRQHIESLGYDIVADFGDQYSDLLGGYTDQTFKLPNPMYYLP